jgi:hypothetical protein
MKTLLQRLYDLDYFGEVARVIGYDGIKAEELEAKIAPLVERFDRGKVQEALIQLTTARNQAPASTVKFLEEVRPLLWQLLGPAPEHPEYAHFRLGEPFKPT